MSYYSNSTQSGSNAQRQHETIINMSIPIQRHDDDMSQTDLTDQQDQTQYQQYYNNDTNLQRASDVGKIEVKSGGLSSCIVKGVSSSGCGVGIGCALVHYYKKTILAKPITFAQMRSRYFIIGIIGTSLGAMYYVPVCQKRRQGLLQQQSMSSVWLQNPGYAQTEQLMTQSSRYDSDFPNSQIAQTLTDGQLKSILVNQAQHGGLTSEQRLLLKQCRRDASWFRCLPICALCWGALTIARKYAPLPLPVGVAWYLGVGFIGYIVGQMSYMNICERNLIEQLKGNLGNETIDRSQAFQPEQSEFSNDTDESINQNPLLPESSPNQRRMTYDELRRRNREEYVDKMRPNYYQQQFNRQKTNENAQWPSSIETDQSTADFNRF